MSINRILADLGKAVDSSSTGNFLNKEASGAEFNPVQWSDINSAPTILDSALASAIIDSAYVQARQTGVGSGGIDSATTIALIDSDYVGARASTGGSGFVKYQYTATASQTTFQDSDANGNVLSYDADYILVHYNGVLLPSADYTATDGSSVVLATGADSGSIIGIAKWGAAAGSSSGSSASWNGDRGFVIIQGDASINYFDVTSPGNASDFGDLIRYSSNARRQGIMTSNGSTIFHYGGRNYSSGSFARSDGIESFASATLGNSSSFGTLTIERSNPGGSSDGTYAVAFAGGTDTDGYGNTIDYFTMASAGNATDFGDATPALGSFKGTVSDGTYGLFAEGQSWSPNQNKIEYITIATPSNSTDFGDLTNPRSAGGSHSDTTRAVFMGGNANGSNTSLNIIDYVAIATPSNATDFGDLSTARDSNPSGVGNNTYACSAGGYSTQSSGSLSSIEYITIQTTSNASSFGNLTTTSYQSPGASGSPS